MPVAPTIAAANPQLALTGTARPALVGQLEALFGSNLIHLLAQALDVLNPRSGRGRPRYYPFAVLLAVLAGARAARSLPAVLTVLQDDQVWERCCEAFRSRRPDDEPLPGDGPSRDHIRYMRMRLTADPHAMAALQDSFQQLSINMATKLGNLKPSGDLPDWARPDPRHVIYGDGTVIKPHTDVTQFIDAASGEPRYEGSRASDPRRVKFQSTLSATSEDGKADKRGLNMVGLYTRTDYGRIVLATGVAMHAEVWAVLDLLDSVLPRAGHGIHTLVYDGAITGWHVDYLMGRHRVQVINKPVKNGTNRVGDEIDHRVKRDRARLGVVENTPAGREARRRSKADFVEETTTWPVGEAFYPTTHGSYDVYDTYYEDLADVVHRTASGHECRHHLVVDDGGVFEVEWDPIDLVRVKTAHIRCATATPHQRPDGRWAVASTWKIPCEHGEVTYEHMWEPEGRRYQRGQEPGRTPTGWRLRPLSRTDDIHHLFGSDPAASVGLAPFKKVYGTRNDAESFNNWFQDTMSTHGRAPSLSVADQTLDWMMTGLLQNVRTWMNYEQYRQFYS